MLAFRAALATAIVVCTFGDLRADEATAILAKQKQTAEANWKSLDLPPTSFVESANFLVYGVLPEPKLKSLSATLEKQFGLAVPALQFDKGDKPWDGKLAVYMFTDRTQFRTFVRQVEKRSPDDLEQGSLALRGEVPHIAAGPGKSKDAPSPETQITQELTAAILAARAKAVPLPEWVIVGFGRATAAHAASQSPGVRKKAARDLLRARLKPRDAWNEMYTLEQRLTLGTAIMDFMIYGKGASKPIDFLGGFRPDDEKPMKTAEDALAAAKLTPEQFDAAFVKWLTSSK